MKKIVSFLLVFVMAISLVVMFSACGDSSSEPQKSKSVSERAQIYGETYARGMILAQYDPTSIPTLRGAVRVVSDTEFVVTGNAVIVQDGYRYKGSFVIELSYSESTDDFEVEDYELSKFYRE